MLESSGRLFHHLYRTPVSGAVDTGHSVHCDVPSEYQLLGQNLHTP